MKSFLLLISAIFIIGCASTTSDHSPLKSDKPTCVGYMAFYYFSLQSVERPEKANQRYGPQRIEAIRNDKKYRFYFEDDLVRISWGITPLNIVFSLQNKTDHSIKIPWDEAGYVDESGRSHRVMHSGVKYTNKEQPIPPSIVVRKGIFEDTILPTDYVYWEEGSRYTTGNWKSNPLFSPYLDIHCPYLTKGTYPSFESFDKAAKSKVGNTLQVLLPLQIEDIVNDYIFIFKIDSVETTQRTEPI